MITVTMHPCGPTGISGVFARGLQMYRRMARGLTGRKLDLRAIAQPRFLRAQVIDWQNLSDDAVVARWIAERPDHVRPTLLFHPSTYLERLSAARAASGRDGDAVPADVGPGRLFSHWLAHGRALGIVPTPLFDRAFYRDRNADLAVWRGDLFDHYLMHGWREPRRACDMFDAAYYLHVAGNVAAAQVSPLEDYVLRGAALGLKPVPDVFLPAPPLDATRLARTTPLEDLAVDVLRRTARVHTPEAKALIAAAAEYAPDIISQGSQVHLGCPPVKHVTTRRLAAGQAVGAALAGCTFDTIVLIDDWPADTLRDAAGLWGPVAIADAATCLVVRVGCALGTETTDSDNRGGHLEDCRVIDLAGLVGGPLDDDERTDVLLDLIRGTGCAHVIDVTSDAGAAVVERYGRQLTNTGVSVTRVDPAEHTT